MMCLLLLDCKVRLLPEQIIPTIPSYLSFRYHQEEKSSLLNKRLYSFLFQVPLHKQATCYLNGIYLEIKEYSHPPSPFYFFSATSSTDSFSIGPNTVVTVDDYADSSMGPSQADSSSITSFLSQIHSLDTHSILPNMEKTFWLILDCILNPILCELTHIDSVTHYRGILISGPSGTGKTAIVYPFSIFYSVL